MTNILFFSTVTRDDESVSSSSRSEISEPPQTTAQASSSAYSVIRKAWRALARPQLQIDDGALARPQLQIDDEDNDNSTTIASVAAEGKLYARGNSKSISFSVLRAATGYFHYSNYLGRGELGSLVYKGWIDENTPTATKAGQRIAVAVKRLNMRRPNDVTKWLEEVYYLGRFNHPNLVRTIGYCTEPRILVYEFMPRGSLKDRLFLWGSDSEPLSWSLRMKIALGAAKCLNFLHSHEARHGNFTPSNILLDSDYNPKVSFGAANGLTPDIDLIGEGGPYFENDYTIPDGYHQEYYIGTCEADVYSFGVVLQEIIIGRKLFGSELRQVLRVQNNMPIPLLDRSLREDQYARRDAKEAVELVNLCLEYYLNGRKTMEHVVKSLTRFSKS